MAEQKDRFYSFQFFCSQDKYRKAVRILEKRNDVSLDPVGIETTRDIFVDGKHVKTLKGITLAGICFRGRLVKVLERLSQRKVTAFNDESKVRVAPLISFENIGPGQFGNEAEDLETRLN